MSLGNIVGLMRRKRELTRHEAWSREQLEAHQMRELAALRAYTCARSPFYRKFHKGLETAPLPELPVLTKQTLMANFDEAAADRAIKLSGVEAHPAKAGPTERYLGRYTVSATSGSTGSRGYFLFAPKEWTFLLATYSRAAWWAGVGPRIGKPMRSVRFGSPVPWHQSVQVGASIESKSLAPMLHLDSTMPMSEIVRQLNDWQPGYVGTYASLARALAEQQLAGALAIKPQMIGCGAEVLTAETRSMIERAFGKVLYDYYGASETGVIATECAEHTGLHCQEDLTIVEIVDAGGNPVPAGAFGERVLVTVLYRRAQPLIRYEISDRVRLQEGTCTCGRPFRRIEAVQGRVEETLYLPGMNGGARAVDSSAFETVLDRVPATQWQVVQDDSGIDILLAGLAPEYADEKIIRPLQSALEGQGLRAPPIRVQRVPAIPRGATGKSPLIKSNLRR